MEPTTTTPPSTKKPRPLLAKVLPHLPIELIREIIIAGIPSQPYVDESDNFPAARYRARWLARLSLVSTEWKDIAIPLLYREAVFELSRTGEEARFRLFYDQIDRRPQLGHHVRRLHWTHDLYQYAESRTLAFIPRSHLFPSLECVSVLSIFTDEPILSLLPCPSPTLPNLRSLQVISWETEQAASLSPTQRAEYCLFQQGRSSDALGTLAQVDEFDLSFADIEIASWLVRRLLEVKASSSSSSSLKHLRLAGNFHLLDPSSPNLHSLLQRVGPTLESLHLSWSGPEHHPLPLPPILTLCLRLTLLSIDGLESFTPLLANGHATLNRLLIGNPSNLANLDSTEEMRQGLVVLLVGTTASDVVKAAEERLEGRSKRFPALRSVGFWDIDFRAAKGRNVPDQRLSLKHEQVALAGKELKDLGIRLEDRFGNCWVDDGSVWWTV